MPKSKKLIVSFNGGELSPLMDARLDQSRYMTGCRTMENFFPQIYGGAERRPGTEYISGCYSNSAKSRLVAFEHSVSEVYILEFANQVIRVFQDGAIVNGPINTEDLSDFSTNLKAHWKCNDNAANTTVTDAVGAHNGTASANTSTLSTTDSNGTANSAFDLGGAADVQVADHNDFTFGDGATDSPFTLLAWVKVVSNGDLQIIVSKYQGAGDREWYFATNNDYLRFQIWDDSVGKYMLVSTYAQLSEGWHFVAATYTANRSSTAAAFENSKKIGMRLYVDWVEVDAYIVNNDSTYVAMENLAADVYIGSYAGNTKYWAGEIDNVAVLNRALTPAEIASIAGQSTTLALEITAPYLTADLFELKFEHSADVMYITHPDYEPRKLSRYSDTVWLLEELALETGPFRDENTDTNATITASATTGLVTLTATGCYPFQSTHIASGVAETSKSKTGTLFRLRHSLSTSYISGLLDVTGANSTSTLSIYKGVTWDLVTNGTWGAAGDSATIVLERSYDNGTTYETVVSFTSAANYNIDTNGTEEIADAIYRLRVTDSAVGGGNCAYNFSVRDTDHIGIVEIATVTSSTSATAVVLTTLGSTNATHRWSEGSWSNYRGWPIAVGISSEERLSFAGSPAEPLTEWGSVIGDYENFKEGTLDDDAIIFTLVGSGKQNRIRWMVPKKAMVIGTVGGEHILGASDDNEVLTPSNVSAKLQTSYGSEDIQAIAIGQATLFVQRGGLKIREMLYDFESDAHKADDLTIFAHHITESGIVDMDFQRTPDPILWCLRDDGVLAVMAYERDQDIFSWSRVVTRSGDTFESVAVVYGGAGSEDEVWVTVARSINGSTVRYIERFAPRDFGGEIEDSFFVDCGDTTTTTTTSTTTSTTTTTYNSDDYTSYPQASYIKAFWKFDETAGTTATDETGSHDGTLNVDASTLTAAGSNTQLCYNFADTYRMSVAHHADFNFTSTAFTFGMWYYVPDLTNNYNIIAKATSDFSSAAYSLSIIAGYPYVYLEDTDAAAWVARVSNAKTTVGWHYFTVTYDGREGSSAEDGITIYIDGSAVAGYNDAGAGTYVAMDTNTYTVYLGAVAAASLNCQRVDNFCVWKGVELSAAEVTTLYADQSVDEETTSTTTYTYTVDSLTWLEGETVALLLDGEVETQKTVSGGSVTVSTSATTVQVGLPYTSTLKPMKLDISNLGLGTVKRITDVFINMYETYGIQTGRDTTHIESVAFDDTSLYTGHKKINFDGDYQRDGDIIIRQTNPLPAVILSITMDVEVNG